MLAGAEITDEARAAAERLIKAASGDARRRMASKRMTMPSRRSRSIDAVDKPAPRPQAKAEHDAAARWRSSAHDQRYYQDDAPTISDAEYDALRQRNDAIEARFPDLRHARIAVAEGRRRAVARLRQGAHAVPMLSLDNAFSDEDVADFVARIRRFLKLEPRTNRSPSPPSRRSTACRCRCATRTASWSRAATRGDGSTARTSPPMSARIKDIPHKLKGKNIPAVCEVRGEVYMTKADFLALNKRQAEAGEHGLRQSAQLRRRLAAPDGCRRSPRRGRCTSSPMPGAR